jgi:hypothetical protein
VGLGRWRIRENAFLLPLDRAGLQFMVDVHCDHQVWFRVPGSEGELRQRVDEWVTEQPASAWKEVTTREGTRGAIRYQVLHARVWVDAGRNEPRRQWHLLVRREIDTPRKVKYTLSNGPAEITKYAVGLDGTITWPSYSWPCCSCSRNGYATVSRRPCSAQPTSKRYSSITCRGATRPSKSSSGYCRRVTIVEDNQPSPIEGDLRQSDKVELVS